MTTLTIFAYGTLRFEGVLFEEYFRHGYLSHVEARAEGRIYKAHGRKGYLGFPVADFNEKGIIKGDILTLESEDPHVRAAILMEMNAGYDLTTVDCYTAERDVRTGVWATRLQATALAFHYGESYSKGEWIEDGDWEKADREHWKALR